LRVPTIPLRRFAYRGDETPDGRFIAFEFLIEGREQGSTVLRLVTNGFLPGGDWAEFDAMGSGGAMYFATLVAYLTYFAGRTATPITAAAPMVPDTRGVFDRVPAALGLSAEPTVGDRVRGHPAGPAGDRGRRGLREPGRYRRAHDRRAVPVHRRVLRPDDRHAPPIRRRRGPQENRAGMAGVAGPPVRVKTKGDKRMRKIVSGSLSRSTAS
jgi:hypothetical protein